VINIGFFNVKIAFRGYNLRAGACQAYEDWVYKMTWYVLTTKPRSEKRAQENLQNQGLEVFYPEFENTRLRQGKKTKTIEALFPGYVFINLNTEQANFNSIRSTRGVGAFVRFGMELATLSDTLIDKLKADTEITAKASAEKMLKTGDKVTITEGPFAGLDAIYQCDDGLERSVLLLQLIQKQSKLVISNTEFEKK